MDHSTGRHHILRGTKLQSPKWRHKSLDCKSWRTLMKRSSCNGDWDTEPCKWILASQSEGNRNEWQNNRLSVLFVLFSTYVFFDAFWDGGSITKSSTFKCGFGTCCWPNTTVIRHFLVECQLDFPDEIRWHLNRSSFQILGALSGKPSLKKTTLRISPGNDIFFGILEISY